MKVIKKFVNKLLGNKPPSGKTAADSGGNTGGKRKTGSSDSKNRHSSSGKQSSGGPSGGSRGKSGSSRKNQAKGGGSNRSRRGGGKSGQSSGKGGSSAPHEKSGSEATHEKGAPAAAHEKGGSAAAHGKSGSSSSGRRRRGGRRSGAKSTERPRSEIAPNQRVNAHSSRTARPSSRSRGSGSSGANRPGGGYSVEERAKLREAHAEWSPDSYQVEPVEGRKRFHDFDLPSEIMHAVSDLNFEFCTPIQALSLEHALAGKNVAGKAQTGTGKTAAFLIAILTRYLRSPEKKQDKPGSPRALVIAPTRELVIQICKDAALIGKYCGLRTLAVYGGMDYQRQKDEVLAEPIDLLVATPGRLLDYTRRRVVDLSQVDTLVIDEADRMLDMGFIPDVRVIMNRLPRKDKRCTMLYSATLSQDVMRLAAQWMDEPVSVEVDPESVATDTVEQVVYVVTASEKFTVLYNILQKYADKRILVFCNRKSTTESVVRKLRRLNIACDMLSGDVNQNRRLRVLEDFRAGKSRIVIATDVA